jgi:hypothetical protein
MQGINCEVSFDLYYKKLIQTIYSIILQYVSKIAL